MAFLDFDAIFSALGDVIKTSEIITKASAEEIEAAVKALGPELNGADSALAKLFGPLDAEVEGDILKFTRNGETIETSARALSLSAAAGDIIDVAKIIDPTLKIDSKVVEAFKAYTKTAPLTQAAESLEGISSLRDVMDTIDGSEIVKDPQSLDDMTAAAEKDSRLKEMFDKASDMLKSGTAKLKWLLVIGAGVLTYELLKEAADRGSGCFKITKTGTSTTRCKVVEYSHNNKSNMPCTNADPVKNPAPSDWNTLEETKRCFLCCPKYKTELDIPKADANNVVYMCVNLSCWDVIGDIIGGVTRDVSSAVDNIIKYAAIAGVVLVGGYALFTLISKSGKNRQYDRFMQALEMEQLENASSGQKRNAHQAGLSKGEPAQPKAIKKKRSSLPEL